MKSAILAAITCCTIAGLAIGADTTPPKKAVTPTKKTATVVVPKKGTAPPSGKPAVTAGPTKTGRTTVPKAGAPKAGTATAGVRTPSKTGTRTTSRRYYARQPATRTYSAQQNQPTSDRYREIQDALAAKGYLKTPSSGVWDKDSVDAMTRFQQDQKLEPTGKLTARSLGALGLGPKPPDTPTGPAASVSATSGGEASPLQ